MRTSENSRGQGSPARAFTSAEERNAGRTGEPLFSDSPLARELELRVGALIDKRVLEVGCGTGATTAVLAGLCRDVVAYDSNEARLHLARARLAEYGRQDQVQFLRTDDIALIATRIGRFDLVLMNGVLEHVPLTTPGLRERIVLTAYSLLRPGGHLFITGTANRLWPLDTRATGLPLLPYLPAGSKLAYRIAAGFGRRRDHVPQSPRQLEEQGVWGATWWELERYLHGTGAICLNLQPGQDDRISYAEQPSPRRRKVEQALYIPAVRFLHAPLTAFAPTLQNLVFRKA